MALIQGGGGPKRGYQTKAVRNSPARRRMAGRAQPDTGEEVSFSGSERGIVQSPARRRMAGKATPKISDTPANTAISGLINASSMDLANAKRNRLTEAGKNYDKAAEDKAAEDQKAEEEEAEKISEQDMADHYYDDLMAYSNANLGGMDVYDIMVVDPYSQEDREMWRALTSDDVLGKYYEDAINQYGDFDTYYDNMVAETLEDVLADQDAQFRHFGAGAATQAIMNGLAAQDYVPAVNGTDEQIAEIMSLLGNDKQASADLMAYMYRQNLAGSMYNDILNGDMTVDDARDILSLQEYSDLGSYGNMEYGRGEGYDIEGDASKAADFQIVDAIDPVEWQKSIDKQYTSLPGYGLHDVGKDRALAKALYGANAREQQGVSDLWAQYDQRVNDDTEGVK